MHLFSNSAIGILVGIGTYDDEPGLSKLDHSHSNVNSLKNLFISENIGFERENIHTIIDSPNKVVLLKKLKNTIRQCKKDIVLFYYSGHGVLSEDDNLFLTTSESTLEDITIDGVDITEISQCFGNKKVIFIFDSCFSERSFKKIKQKNFTAIASSSVNNTSKYLEGMRYSVFTNELIDILTCGIDNSKETLTLSDIYNELNIRLTKKSKDLEPRMANSNEIFNMPFTKNNFGMPLYEIQINEFTSKNSIIEGINESLITSSVENTNAPKNIKNIFVVPSIFNYPEEKYQALKNMDEEYVEERKEYNLIDIISDDKNYLFLGKKESGKTTLLYYIINEILSDSLTTEYLPAFIDFNSISPKNRKPMQREIRKFLELKPLEYKKLIRRNKKFLILIDNYDTSDLLRKKIVDNFISLHSNYKFIFASSEKASYSLETDVEENKSDDLISVYLHSFNTKQISSLVDSWFSNSEKGTNEINKIKNHISKTLTFTRIPSFPINICFLLLIFESSEILTKVINKASLVEEFVETVLEKFVRHEIFGLENISIDYRTKQHYLSILATKMVRSSNYHFDYAELAKITKDFFGRFGDAKIDIENLLRYFISKGIIIKKGVNYSFKFRCFAEYFIAKGMIDDSRFYDFIVDESKFLHFRNELDYYTALTRNDLNLMKIVEERLEAYISEDSNYQNINLENFLNQNSSNKSFFEGNSFLLDSLKEETEDENEDNEEDKLDLSMIYNSSPALLDQEIKREINEDDKSRKFPKALNIYSIIIKNSEFLDLQTKNNALKKCLKYWGIATVRATQMFNEELTKDNLVSIISSLNETSENIDSKQEEIIRKNLEEKHEELTDLANMTSIAFISKILLDILGNERLQLSLSYSELKHEDFLVRYLGAFLYSELQLIGFMDYLKKLFDEMPKIDFLIRAFHFKLLTLYIQGYDLSEAQLKKLEDLIVEINLKHILKIERKREKELYKVKILKNLKKQKMLFRKGYA